MAENDRRLRIVHIDTGMGLRGGQRQLLLLAEGLRQKNHEQLIVCPEESTLERQARHEGYRVFSLPAHDPVHFHGALQLRHQLLAEPCEILHAHDGRGQTLAWLASLGLPVRRVASRRVTFLPRSVVSHRLKYAATCHGLIAVSAFIRQLLIESGLPAEKIEIIPDGIEVPEELPDPGARARIREEWGFGPEDFVVGHVGTFTVEKGQDVAVEAALRLLDQTPRAYLLLAGDGPMRSLPALQARVRQAQGRVRLLGALSDLSDFFASLDLFIMPSRAEGLGSAVLMAMAHGLPVIATRVGGLPEIVEEGKTGWLVPPESPSALAEAIATATRNRVMLAQVGANGRRRARQFSSDIMVERTEYLYRRLLAS